MLPAKAVRNSTTEGVMWEKKSDDSLFLWKRRNKNHFESEGDTGGSVFFIEVITTYIQMQ